MFSLICGWINGWVNNREAGDLRRYLAHYDVMVMVWIHPAKAGTSLVMLTVLDKTVLSTLRKEPQPLPYKPWWRHQMETFSALLGICAGNSPVPGEFPTQRPVTRSFDVYFDLRPNKWLSKQSWGWWFETLSCSLWRHRNAKRILCNDIIFIVTNHPETDWYKIDKEYKACMFFDCHV